MIARRKLLVLATAVLAPLTMVGVSAAMQGDPSADAPPADEAPHGAAVSAAAQECPVGPQHGPCVSAVAGGSGGAEDEPEQPEAEAPDVDETENDAEGAGGPPEDTHGYAVSTAAKECPEGPGHGACVSDVASSKSQGRGSDKADGRKGPPESVPGGRGNGKGGPSAGVGGGRP